MAVGRELANETGDGDAETDIDVHERRFQAVLDKAHPHAHEP